MYGETTLGRKSKTDKSIVTERKLKFRSNGEVLCGARFSNFPEEIGVDPKEFLEAFETAVATANDETIPAVESDVKAPVKTPVKAKKEKPVVEQESVPEPSVESDEPFEDEKESETEVVGTVNNTEDLIKDISNEIDKADLDNSDKKELVKEFIALGVAKGNYKIIKDTDLLLEILEIVKGF